MNSYKFTFLFCVLLTALHSFSQKKFVRNGNFYLSWGYNKEWYSTSNIHADLPGLNSNFTFNNIRANDHIGWDKLFQRALTIPQYNYRIGYFFNEKQDLAFELNFDHTKYVVANGQTTRVTGTLKGRNVDTTIVVASNTLVYQLNNGANFFLFNLVKKFNLINTANNGMVISGLAKFGVGPLVPHVENTIFGNSNTPHFQLGGWNTGIEAGLRAVFAKHVYLEFTNKIDYARYFGLEVYQGKVNQSFFCYELILSLGYTFKFQSPKKCDTCPDNLGK